MKFGFGTQLWLRNNHYENFYRMLVEVALEGLDGFECAPAFLVDWYGKKPDELRKILDMMGLEVSSYYLHGEYYDKEGREASIKEQKRRSDFMADLGYQNVLLDGGRKIPGLSAQQFDDYIKQVAETANHLGQYAKSKGLTLSWHQHWGSIFEVQATFHRLMELTDPDLVGFCCDVGQLALGDFDTLETVERYASQGRIRFMHYKDLTRDGRPEKRLWDGYDVPSDMGAYNVDSKFRWVELGRGLVDFPGITKILLKYGYDGWLVDDFDFTGYEPRASVRACKNYINKALGIKTERDIREGK
ncbi:MAG: sugar phosphate isomerase/epimerase [Oscillospiraceae bacterium]|nr:sugar phosphate isomerase/epimerase [Oscillospiraceae bacterium]